jgi:hypothetical protein
LARELVKQKKLTAYQAKVIYQGKGKNLVLGNYRILDKLGEGDRFGRGEQQRSTCPDAGDEVFDHRSIGIPTTIAGRGDRTVVADNVDTGVR